MGFGRRASGLTNAQCSTVLVPWLMPHLTQIPVQDAIRIVAKEAPTPTLEAVELNRALGRTLATDIASLADHPTVDNSALDGYACRVVDTETATDERPVRLVVIGEVPAGTPFSGTVGPGQAVGIYTGGAVPAGATGIVPVEVTSEQDGVVSVSRPATASAIRLRAQDLKRGSVYLEAGRRLSVADLALAAGMGQDRVSVGRRPRLAVLSTGDEVVPPGRSLKRGQVYDSNTTAIGLLAQAAGADVVLLPHVGDDIEVLGEAIDSAGEIDLLITSGGVSMGRYDIVRDLLFERGVVLFWKVAMRPGGPVLFGRWRDLPVLGLPGNPVSTMIVFLTLGRAFVQAALGSSEPLPYDSRILATAEEPLSAAGFKETFHRVILESREGRHLVRGTGNQNSGILRSMVEANGLAVLPSHARIEAGEQVEVIPLEPYLR